MQLEVSTAFMQVKVLAANMWVTIFIEIMYVGVSVIIMQVVFSTVHYAHDYFCVIMQVTVSVILMYVTGSSSNFIFLSLTDNHFIKLTRKGQRASLSNSRRPLANADVIADVKNKIIVSRQHFLPTGFFLPLQKFETIKTKLEKNSYTQTNACLLHISRNFKDIFKYMCFTLYL